MKYCKHCGAENFDEAIICPKCGCSLVEDDLVSKNKSEKSSTLKLVAFVFSIISTISLGWTLIPLLWCVPMTISIYKAYKGEKQLSSGFKVCVLLFVNVVAGILLLIDND